MFDYGWIENADRACPVWEMQELGILFIRAISV
jgi:hypothetical protein